MLELFFNPKSAKTIIFYENRDILIKSNNQKFDNLDLGAT